MDSVARILIIALPVLVLPLLLGLGLIIHVLASEGRTRSALASQVVGVVNLAMLIPLAILAWAAPSPAHRRVFMFVAVAFVLLGLLGVQMPRRFRD